MSRNKSRTYKYKTLNVDRYRKRDNARYNDKQNRSFIARISRLVGRLSMCDDVSIQPPRLNVHLSGYSMVSLCKPKKLKQTIKWIVKYKDRDGHMVEPIRYR